MSQRRMLLLLIRVTLVALLMVGCSASELGRAELASSATNTPSPIAMAVSRAATPYPTYTRYPTYTPPPTATTVPTSTLTRTPTASPPPTATRTQPPTATLTLTPVPTSTPTFAPTDTPRPTDTPKPTNPPAPPARVRGKIVFASDVARENNIYVMNANGSNWVQLTTGGGFSPRWSAVNQRIVFASPMEGNTEIYTMRIDGSDRQRLTHHAAWDGSPDWSPDGKRIVFSSDRAGSQDLWVMNADGSELMQLTRTETGPIKGQESRPRWSPDGSKILCFVGRDHTNDGKVDKWRDDSDVWILNPDGSDFRRLLPSNSKRNYCCPVWHPNSFTFAYGYLDWDYARTHGTGWQIYAMNIDGTEQRLVYDSATSDCPSAWSADGSRLLLSSWPVGHWEIFVLSIGDSVVTPLSMTQPGQQGHGSADWVE